MIRFACKEDIGNIMRFISEHWRENHILSRDRELFEFQHLWKDEVTFVLSEQQGKIDGLLGYIPYGSGKRDVMLALWKTLKTPDSMLGVKMLDFLRKDPGVNRISAPGINPRTEPIYQFLGMPTGCMKHWYRLRKGSLYKIALVRDFRIPEVSVTDFQIKECDTFEEFLNFCPEECLMKEHHPYKSFDYLKRRYFFHPSYHYLKYGICGKGKKLVVILRIQECRGSFALRVIDGIGDEELLEYFTSFMDGLMEQYGCEYADCYEAGVQAEVMERGGWKLVAETNNVIPEYFSPFEQRNVEIYFMSQIPQAVLFKGDGDMDRPN